MDVRALTFDCVGGHEPQVMFRKERGACEVLNATGPWLGIAGQLARVPVGELALAPGDVLCLYTDGITEAKDASGELFDTERLSHVIAEALTSDSNLERVADRIVGAVESHSQERDDDWTMLLVRRLSGEDHAPSYR